MPNANETTSTTLNMTEMTERLEAMVPDALKALPACVWGFEEGRKMPYHPRTGSKCRPNSAKSWSTWDRAIDKLTSGIRIEGEQEYRGLGVFLGELEDPCGEVCVDIDFKKYAGELDENGFPPIVTEIIKRFNSYTELSQSGLGVHVFVRGHMTRNRRMRALLEEGVDMECYAEVRYIALTGDVRYIDGDGDYGTIEERQDELDWLLETYLSGGAASISDDEAKQARGTMTETVLIGSAAEAVAHACRTDAVFASLYTTGKAPEDVMIGDGSGSSLDFRFLTKLIWYGLSFETIDTVYRQSALYRPKWDRERFHDDTSHEIIPGSYAAMTLNSAWLAQMVRGDDGQLLRDAAGQMIPQRYAGKSVKPSVPSVATETVQARYVAIRPLMIEAVTSLRGTPRQRHTYLTLVDALLDLVRDGQFVVDGSDVRILNAGLDGLSVLVRSDRTSTGERLEFLAEQGLLGGIRKPEKKGDSVQVLLPADPTELIALRQEGLLSGVTIPDTTAALRRKTRTAEQKAAGTLKPRKSGPRAPAQPATLRRSRYTFDAAAARHTTSVVELAQATRESIGTTRRCVRVLVDGVYLVRLPGRRLMVTEGAQERFAADLEAEFDRCNRYAAVMMQRRRVRFYQQELMKNGESRWNDRLQDAQERIARLEAGESVRSCQAA